MSSANLTDSKINFQSYYPSLASLREAHKELLIRHRNTAFSTELASEIAAFMIKGSSTGVILDGEKDRWAAQGILDYWLSVLYSEDIEPPEATLADFDLSLSPELDDSLCPYLGLEAFREKDRQYFYGRQRLLDKLINKLKESQLLAVVGSSGSGKSSVVLGGLIPSLKGGKLSGSENWHYYASMVPGSNPLANLARLFCPEDVEVSVWIEQQTQQFLQNPNHLSQLLSHTDGQPSVLVIDQFEEMFTLCLDETKRHAFIKNLLGIIESPEIPHRIILTMRTDFESWVAKIPIFYPLFEKAKVHVTPLDASELREAIEKPANLVGLKFEEGLVDKLIQDVLGEPAALPLLQFTLLKLWDNRERNRITQEAYQKLGGGRLALSNSADEFYNNLIPEEQLTCKRIFLKMVRPTEGLEVTSSRIPIKELYQIGEASDRIERVLDKLIEARLVRLTKGDTPNDTQVEVAHEALIRNWHQLLEWLEDERVNLRQRLRLKIAAIQWEEQERDNSALLRGALLEEARRYDDLTDLEQKFIRVSNKKELQNRRLKFSFFSFGVIIAFSALPILNWYAWQKNIEINKKTQTAMLKAQEAKKEAESATQKATLKAQEAQEEQERAQNLQKEIENIKQEQTNNTRRITDILDHHIIDPISIALNNNRTITQREMKNIRQQSWEIRAIVEEGNILAKEYEIKGFQALVDDRNLKQAKDYFGKAYEAGPTYHSVDEINKLLRPEIIQEYEDPNTPDSIKQRIMNDIYKQIVEEYDRGAPQQQIEEMKRRIELN